MLITIIIPFNNRFKYVNSAIESILRQTYTNWELILIDDASSDRFIQCFQDSRIKLIRNQYNIGPGASRQKGIEASKGRYICFLDSDDVYTPDFLEKNLEKHSKSDIDLSFTYCKTVKAENNSTYKTSNLQFDVILPTLLTENRPWHTSSLFWNRKYLPLWNNNSRTWEDYQFEFDAAFLNNKIGFIDEVLCHIYVDETFGLSNNSDKFSGIVDRLKVLNYMHTKNLESDLVFKKILYRNIKIRINKDILKLQGFNLSSVEYLRLLENLGVVKNLFQKFILFIIYRKPLLSKILFKYGL